MSSRGQKIRVSSETAPQGLGRIASIPLLPAESPMFALRMLIALGEEIWICQFPIKVPKLEDENWEILGVISHGGNRLETEPLRF